MEETENLKKIVLSTFDTAVEKQQEFITPEQFLLSALNEKLVRGLFVSIGGNVDRIKSELDSYIKNNVPILENHDASTPYTPDVSYAMNEIYQNAQMHASGAGKKVLDVFDIIVAMFMNTKLHASYIMKKNNVEQLPLLEAISMYRKSTADEERFPVDHDDPSHLSSKDIDFNIEDMFDDDDEDMDDDDYDFEFDNETFLERYTENMTEMARQKKLNKLIGREEEIERTIQILCRLSKNNPVHVGEAGVGKTAIAQGLAQRLASGKVPKRLKGYEIYSVTMADIIAGTRFRGDFEQRLKRIIV